LKNITISHFGDYVDQIYAIDLEIEDTTDTARSASYLVLHIEIDRRIKNKTL
jgi:hypothetical protein